MLRAQLKTNEVEMHRTMAIVKAVLGDGEGAYDSLQDYIGALFPDLASEKRDLIQDMQMQFKKYEGRSIGIKR